MIVIVETFPVKGTTVISVAAGSAAAHCVTACVVPPLIEIVPVPALVLVKPPKKVTLSLQGIAGLKVNVTVAETDPSALPCA